MKEPQSGASPKSIKAELPLIDIYTPINHIKSKISVLNPYPNRLNPKSRFHLTYFGYPIDNDLEDLIETLFITYDCQKIVEIVEINVTYNPFLNYDPYEEFPEPPVTSRSGLDNFENKEIWIGLEEYLDEIALCIVDTHFKNSTKEVSLEGLAFKATLPYLGQHILRQKKAVISRTLELAEADLDIAWNLIRETRPAPSFVPDDFEFDAPFYELIKIATRMKSIEVNKSKGVKTSQEHLQRTSKALARRHTKALNTMKEIASPAVYSKIVYVLELFEIDV